MRACPRAVGAVVRCRPPSLNARALTTCARARARATREREGAAAARRRRAQMHARRAARAAPAARAVRDARARAASAATHAVAQPQPLRSGQSAVPLAPQLPASELATLERLLERPNLLVITGAGASTESGLPDYRGPQGAYTTDKGWRPTTHQEFCQSSASRQRYWARSFRGWPTMRDAQPGPAHLALQRLRLQGRVDRLVTQNVDGLHGKVGDDDVVELHGSLWRVRCLSCGAESGREEMQERMAELNYALPLPKRAATAGAKASTRRPDGDVEISSAAWESFRVPLCRSCGSDMLKPEVVFFGDSLDPEVRERAATYAHEAGALLVVGSTMKTMSAYRLAAAMAERGKLIGVLGCGETRVDSLAAHKWEAVVGETLGRLC